MHGVSPTLSPPKFPWSHASPERRVGPSTASAALCELLGVHSLCGPWEDSRVRIPATSRLPFRGLHPGALPSPRSRCFVLPDSVLSPEVRVQKNGG